MESWMSHSSSQIESVRHNESLVPETPAIHSVTTGCHLPSGILLATNWAVSCLL